MEQHLFHYKMGTKRCRSWHIKILELFKKEETDDTQLTLTYCTGCWNASHQAPTLDMTLHNKLIKLGKVYIIDKKFYFHY